MSNTMISPSELQKQNDELQATLLRVKRDDERTIQNLKKQLDHFLNPPISNSSSSKEQDLQNYIANLKRMHSEEISQISSSNQHKISKCQYEIAEMKNQLAELEAKNAHLLIENLQLKEKENELIIAKEHINEWSKKLDTIFDPSIIRINQAFSNVGAQLSSTLQKNKDMINNTQKFYVAIEYLLRCIQIISGIPMNSAPSIKTCVDEPQKLIEFISYAQNFAEKEKKELEDSLSTAYEQIRSLKEKLKTGPLSQPVVKVLTSLGSTLLELSEQMDEEHNETLALLNSQISNQE